MQNASSIFRGLHSLGRVDFSQKQLDAVYREISVIVQVARGESVRARSIDIDAAGNIRIFIIFRRVKKLTILWLEIDWRVSLEHSCLPKARKGLTI